ncbi:hypothetical protein NCC49_004110 [Naganishia albida]|nr:hypothetical protein NCC49_004110 [Naganishia albida]
MITGIGVDILHLSRLRHLIHRRGADRLARRILAAGEMAEFRALSSPGKEESIEEQTRYLASRWAAKEALYKAAYPTFKLSWKQIQLGKDAGKPFLRVTSPPPTASDIADPQTRNLPTVGDVHDRIHVSLSHDADLVVAYVVVESVP